MFYWIQTYLTKHFKWMLVILLAVIIVSFVFTIGNFSPLGSGGQRYREQPFFGYDLSSENDQREIFGRGQISLSVNLPPFYSPNEADIQNYSLSRIAFLQLAEKIGIPGPTKQEFKAHIRELPAFMNFSTQEFDQTRFTSFIQSLTARGLTESDVTSVIGDDYRINKVRDLLQGPGHILPFEAVQTAQRQHTQWTLETAKMAYGDFSIDITPTREDLEKFFQANIFRYEVAAKAKAAFIVFDPQKYIDTAYQPEAGEKSIHFFTNKARYQAGIPAPEPIKKEDGTTETPEAPEVTLADVESRVVEEIRLERAKTEAQRVAEQFAYNLFDHGVKNGSPAFAAALKKAGVTLNTLTPFSEGNILNQQGLTSQTLNQIFRLNGRYFSDPIQNGEVFVILINQGEEPSYIPKLEEVQVKLTADFKEEKKRALFIEKGEEIREAVATAISNGTSFADAAKAQNLTHQVFESFNQTNTVPDGLDRNLLGQLDDLNEGAVSDWVANATEGTLIFAAKKEVPNFTIDSEEVKSYIESQAPALSSGNVQPIMSDLLEPELANTAFGRP